MLLVMTAAEGPSYAVEEPACPYTAELYAPRILGSQVHLHAITTEDRRE